MPISDGRNAPPSLLSRREVLGRALLGAGALGLLPAFLAACGGGSSASTTTAGTGAGALRSGGEAAVWLDSSPVSLDPHVDITLSALYIDYALYDPLFDVTKGGTGDFVPWVVTRWSRDDPTSWVLALREGVVFQDGTPLDAEAVKFNLERVAAGVPGSTIGSIPQIANVTATGAHAVKVETDGVYAPLLGALAGQLGLQVSPTAVKAAGKSFGSRPVGSGPFKFVEFAKNDHVRVERFPGYWKKDRPHLDAVDYKVIPDPTTAVSSLLDGQLNVLPYVVANLIKRVQGSAQVEFQGGGYLLCGVSFLAVNGTRTDLEDPAVRQAIGLAVDRDGMAKTLNLGWAGAASSLLTPASWAHDPDLPPIGFDLAQAKSRLGGKRLSLELKTDPDVYKSTAEVIAADLDKIGVDTHLRTIEFGQLIADFVSGDYDLMVVDNVSPFYDPDLMLAPYYGKGGLVPYVDPKLNDLLTQARQVFDRAQRKPLYAAIERRAQEVATVVPILWYKTTGAHTTALGGVTSRPDLVLDAANWAFTA